MLLMKHNRRIVTGGVLWADKPKAAPIVLKADAPQVVVTHGQATMPVTAAAPPPAKKAKRGRK